MSGFRISEAQAKQFEDDGYLFVPGLLDAEEVDLLGKIARADHEMVSGALDRLDAAGNVTKLALRNELLDDTYSAIMRSERMVRTMEAMLGGEVYHYHHKMSLKEPRVGGAWEWHQDYGYWYDNGCLFPYMASCMISVDRSTKSNGCLQVIKGSHHMGRINHVTIGTQTGADPERVEQALKVLELVYCEMEPGTGLFFHGNLLHRSDANTSDDPRWTLIGCYNAARNNPYKKHHHPCYEPLEVWPDSRIKEMAREEWEQMQAKTGA